ncbi:hypothetical protein HMSSN036_27200 [Paenibacillus macerans]|nr:hypothetical protein HMSSN036_27200 [Paenibacillus macerans]
MIYTALGDSITFGENATSPAKAYPQLVVSSLNAANSRKVSGFVLAGRVGAAMSCWTPFYGGIRP